VSSEKSEDNSSDISLGKVMTKSARKKKSSSKVEKLFRTEKKARFSSSNGVNDPFIRKQSGSSENLEKALDDMLLSTPLAPMLRSGEKSESKKDKDTEMLPPRDRKGKMKRLARKKRLEKLLEAKNKQKQNKKQ
jgi:hypothetical protein